MGKLNDVDLRKWLRAGEPVAKADGDGLTFSLSPKGVAAWTLRYRLGGKQKELTLGRYPDMTLTKARAQAAEKRVAVQQGVDVAQEKQIEFCARWRTEGFSEPQPKRYNSPRRPNPDASEVGEKPLRSVIPA